MYFFTLLFLSTILCILSTSWFLMWVMLEINTFTFMSIITFSYSFSSYECSMKYFIIQTLSAIFIILWFFLSNSLNALGVVVMVSLMLKMAAVPFHMWFPQISNYLKFSNLYVLFTWQKLAPIWMICFFKWNYLILPIILSALLGSLSQFSMMFFRPILAFSSITHISWMLMSMFINIKFFFLYLTIYAISILAVFIILEMSNLEHLESTSSYKWDALLILLFMLSMGGMPPTVGFLTKWVILLFITSLNMGLVFMVLLFSSVINLYIYLRMMMSNMQYSMESNIKNKKEKLVLMTLLMLNLWWIILMLC